MKIDAVYNVTDTDMNKFIDMVCEDIRLMQDRFLEVEIQYKPLAIGNQIAYNALILGRK